MRTFLSLAITLTVLAACAQPGPKPITQSHRCDPISPDSVDITGDGIADLEGISTLPFGLREGLSRPYFVAQHSRSSGYARVSRLVWPRDPSRSLPKAMLRCPLVICGQAGVTTLDKLPRVVMCHAVVRTLPGTHLLSSLHPMGGRIIRGFVRGEPIPALDGVPVDPAEAGRGMRDPRHAFIAGEVRALTWSQAGNTVSAAHRASMAEGVFVFATAEAGRVVHGTFRLRTDPKKRTVRIRPGNRSVGMKP